MKCIHAIKDSSLQSGKYLVVSLRESEKVHLIEKLSFFATDVQELTVNDPCQLYEIDDYSFDVLIVSDGSVLSDFSRACYRILRDISPDVLLIAESQRQIDVHNLSDTIIQFDGTICFDADAVNVQLTIMDALKKRELRLKKMNDCLESRIYTKLTQEIKKSVQVRQRSPIWLEILLGFLCLAIGVILISSFRNITS